MNNIHEKDWATEPWGGYSGMGSNADYSIVDENESDKNVKNPESCGDNRSENCSD